MVKIGFKSFLYKTLLTKKAQMLYLRESDIIVNSKKI